MKTQKKNGQNIKGISTGTANCHAERKKKRKRAESPIICIYCIYATWILRILNDCFIFYKFNFNCKPDESSSILSFEDKIIRKFYSIAFDLSI